MSELNFLSLYNCTDLLFHDADANDSLNNGVRTVWDLNKTQLLTVLSIIIDDEDDTFDHQRKELFKETLSRCLFPKRQRPHDLPLWEKAFWSVIFAAMLIVATTGNIIVMWIVLGHRRMRTVTNYFLVNLSVSDLFMSLLNCIFNCIFMINSDWPFGSVYCTINNFVANVSVAASVFTLVAISIDRYVAIVTPLKHRMSKATARITLLFIWFASCMLAFPCLLYSSTMTKSYRNGQTRTVCYMLWPDGRYPKSMTEYVYNLVFLSLTYLIPVVAMAVCYTLMGRKLWGSQYIGEQTQCQVEAMRSKRKVVRMFIIIVAIFALCWLPYHGYFIYVYHNNSIADSSYVQHMYLAFYWLAMSNAMVNPIIYYWLNNRFRSYFRQIICKCWPGKNLKEDFELPDTKYSIRENVVRRTKTGRFQRRQTGKQVRLQNFVDKTILAEHSKHFSSIVSNSCSNMDN